MLREAEDKKNPWPGWGNFFATLTKPLVTLIPNIRWHYDPFASAGMLHPIAGMYKTIGETFLYGQRRNDDGKYRPTVSLFKILNPFMWVYTACSAIEAGLIAVIDGIVPKSKDGQSQTTVGARITKAVLLFPFRVIRTLVALPAFIELAPPVAWVINTVSSLARKLWGLFGFKKKAPAEEEEALLESSKEAEANSNSVLTAAFSKPKKTVTFAADVKDTSGAKQLHDANKTVYPQPKPLVRDQVSAIDIPANVGASAAQGVELADTSQQAQPQPEPLPLSAEQILTANIILLENWIALLGVAIQQSKNLHANSAALLFTNRSAAPRESAKPSEPGIKQDQKQSRQD